MFAWRAEVLLAEIARLMPELHQGLLEIGPDLGTPREAAALARVYPRLPSQSVDYGVLEKSDRLRVVRADFGWSDVGSFEAMAELWPADQAGNASQEGRVLAVEAANNVVAAQGRLAALLGVSGLTVVVTEDVVMVLPTKRCQEVRRFIEALEGEGAGEYL